MTSGPELTRLDMHSKVNSGTHHWLYEAAISENLDSSAKGLMFLCNLN